METGDGPIAWQDAAARMRHRSPVLCHQAAASRCYGFPDRVVRWQITFELPAVRRHLNLTLWPGRSPTATIPAMSGESSAMTRRNGMVYSFVIVRGSETKNTAP